MGSSIDGEELHSIRRTLEAVNHMRIGLIKRIVPMLQPASLFKIASETIAPTNVDSLSPPFSRNIRSQSPHSGNSDIHPVWFLKISSSCAKGAVLECVKRKFEKNGNFMLVVSKGAEHEQYSDMDTHRMIMEEMKLYFKENGRDISRKYLDPEYQMRAIPKTIHGHVLGILVAHAAVHGEYARFTGFSNGPFNVTNIPTCCICSR